LMYTPHRRHRSVHFETVEHIVNPIKPPNVETVDNRVRLVVRGLGKIHFWKVVPQKQSDFVFHDASTHEFTKGCLPSNISQPIRAPVCQVLGGGRVFMLIMKK